MKKKITSLLLGLTLCLSLLPAAALADDAPLYEWKSQVPEDPDAITYDIEVADFGTMEYGYRKEDCPTLTISFTNTSDQTLWYIHDFSSKGGDRFNVTVPREGWDSIRQYLVIPVSTYALELKPGSSASVNVTLYTGYRESTSFPAGVYDGELDFFFATSDEPVGRNRYDEPIFEGGNYPLPYHFEIVYDGYMGGEEAMELDRESVDFGPVEMEDTVTETVSVTNRAKVAIELQAKLASEGTNHGAFERSVQQCLELKEKQWTLAPGETAQVEIVKGTTGNNKLPGRYDTELVLTSEYRVEGGGNLMSYRDEKVVPITLTPVKGGNLSILVQLESPQGPSGYLTSADGATTYWGNENIDVPYGGDLSLNIVPFVPEHGYVLAIQQFSSSSSYHYVGHDTTLLAQDVTDRQHYRVVIASCAVPPADWARDAVGRAYSLGIFSPGGDMPGLGSGGDHGVNGKIPDSSYAAPITRKDFCNLAMEIYLKLRPEEYRELPNPLPTSFTDTDDMNVRRLAYLKVITGVGDEKFDPDGQLTREQAAAILSRLAGVLDIDLDKAAPTFDDNGSISPWASEAVGQMQAAGIMSGVGNNQFGPQGTYSWEQSIATLMRIYDMTM